MRHYRVTLEDVIEAHEIALQREGGLPGIRDMALIESAIGRPYTGYYKSVQAKAAALTQSLSKNHGFLDGNKRTTLLILSHFLNQSGYVLVGPDETKIGQWITQQEAEVLANTADRMIEKVATNEMTYPDLVTWFRAHIREK